MYRIIFVLILFSSCLSSCFYDKQNALHPTAADPCDNEQAPVFNQSVDLILRNNCTSCHAGSNPSGGVRLDNYTQVTSAARSGKLLGSIKHDGSAVAMPPTSKLRECEISKIEIWINNGLPEK